MYELVDFGGDFGDNSLVNFQSYLTMRTLDQSLVFKIGSAINIHPLYCTEVLEIITRKNKKFVYLLEKTFLSLGIMVKYEYLSVTYFL